MVHYCNYCTVHNGMGEMTPIGKKKKAFKKGQKMVTKLGQFTKLGPFSTFQIFKLSKLCHHFLSYFENENNFFDIPSNPPPIAVRNSLTNKFFQKK